MVYKKYSNHDGEFYLRIDGNQIMFVCLLNDGKAKISNCEYVQEQVVLEQKLRLDKSTRKEFNDNLSKALCKLKD